MLCDLSKISHPKRNKVSDSRNDANRNYQVVGLGYESMLSAEWTTLMGGANGKRVNRFPPKCSDISLLSRPGTIGRGTFLNYVYTKTMKHKIY